MAAAPSSKKRRSAAVAPAADAVTAAAGRSDAHAVVGDSKKRRVAKEAAPPLSAVARRRLAAEQELKRQQEEQKLELGSAAGRAEAAESNADSKSQNSEALEDSDEPEDGEEDNDNDAEPMASTSKEPYSSLLNHDKAPKRYFLGAAASLDSSTAPSPVGDDTEASAIASEGEYIQTGDTSRAESLSYTKRPSRRRRRADNATNFFLDPGCASTWRPAEDNHRRLLVSDGLSGQLVGLYPGETIVLRGCCSLMVLRGAISIDCAVITASSRPITIMSPSTHALPIIRAVRSPLTRQAEQQGGSDRSTEGLEQPIIIELHSMHSGVEGIESVCRVVGMPIPSGGMWQLSNRWPSGSEESKDTYKVLLEPERDHCATVVPHNWVEALDNVALASPSGNREGASTYVIQGPKGVGKSTFSRLLANTLLSHQPVIAYLDCDLGQPEFTPSGILSLSVIKNPILGPSFTHLNCRPERMHYLGSVTPKNDPSFYLWAISDLMDHYATLTDDQGNAIPLIVNTQGWYRGLGADLLLEIHRKTRPSVCFDFSGGVHPNADASVFAAGASVAVIDPALDTEVIPMQPHTMPENGPPRLNASDLRILQLISYFHLSSSSFAAFPKMPTWDFSASLLARPPYLVPFSAFTSIKFATNESIDFPDVLRALDVSIVALREEDISQDESLGVNGAEGLSTTDGLRRAYERGHLQHPSQCIGLGIIRALDTATSTVHIVTPLPPADLETVNAITKGDLEIPTVMMVDYAADGDAEEDSGLAGVDWKKVPYLEFGENLNAGVGHARRRVRRNVMRRSQFR